MFEKEDEITLDNGSKFLVFDSFKINDKNYLYLVSLEKDSGVAIVENNNGILNEINDEKEYNLVFNELVRRNKEEIAKYMKDINGN